MTYDQYGTPDSLSLNDMETPKVAPGTALIAVRRAGVNPVDWKVMAGGLDPMLDIVFPAIPGWDVAGVVEAVGPDTPEVSVGDRVAAYARKDVVAGGTYAEYVTIPVSAIAHIPDGVDDEQAAGLPLAGLTALRCLERLELSNQDTLLIHAASGGVGRIAAQLAVHTGATVIGTAGEQNHQRLREMGVTPVQYGDGLVARVKELAPHGVSAVADFVGGVLHDTLALMEPEPGSARTRHVSIADPDVQEHSGALIWVRPDGQRLRTLLEHIDTGQIVVDIDEVMPLSDAAKAMERSREGRTRGKLVLDATR